MQAKTGAIAIGTVAVAVTYTASLFRSDAPKAVAPARAPSAAAPAAPGSSVSAPVAIGPGVAIGPPVAIGPGVAIGPPVAIGPGAAIGPAAMPRSTAVAPRRAAPPETNPAAPASATATASTAAAKSDAPGYSTVKVFYATDRAIDHSSPAARQRDFCLAGVAAALALAALAGWLFLHGHHRIGIASGIGAVGAVVLVIALLPGWLSRRGISEAYVSGSLYGAGRGALALGYCEVTIPDSHRVGEVETPSILRLEFTARQDEHVILQQIVPQEQQAFYDAVRQRVSQSPQHDLFVFVHGFNVSFEAAARRTAQISHDLDYAGAPIFFSWPSQAKPWRYTVDETNVTWAVPHLKRFLRDLAAKSNAQSIHLIAHSMGNRALTQAIYELGYECQQDKKLFQQVILAAPDIDADVFREQIAPAITKCSSRITLYASANDEALAASKLVHGSWRAGESATPPLTVPGVETIDVEMAELGPLGHSYYGSSPLILQDLAAILREAAPASQRPWLSPVGAWGAMYWRLTDAPSVASAAAGLPTTAR